MTDTTETHVHAHEVLRLLVEADTAPTVDGLRRELEQRFGAACRFESCSASGMDFEQLLQFLLRRGKIGIIDGTVTADPLKICNHD